MNPERLDRLINQPSDIHWHPSYWFLNPKSPYWGREVVTLIILGILQVNILPRFTGYLEICDFLTPTLVIASIRLSLTRVAIAYATVCLFLESHHSFPAGFYFCSYAVLVSSMLFIRDQISWRQHSSWLTSIAACCAWIIIFRMFVYTISLGRVDASFSFWAGNLLAYGISFTLGVFLMRVLRADFIDEMGALP